AVPEAAAGVLLRPGRRLHDAVEADVLDDDDPAHDAPPARSKLNGVVNSTPMSPPDDKTESRSARKHRAILEAATRVFLAHGYAGTTIDQIAAEAAVSKPTV